MNKEYVIYFRRIYDFFPFIFRTNACTPICMILHSLQNSLLFVQDQSLHTATNYLISSLALADLLVGTQISKFIRKSRLELGKERSLNNSIQKEIYLLKKNLHKSSRLYTVLCKQASIAMCIAQNLKRKFLIPRIFVGSEAILQRLAEIASKIDIQSGKGSHIQNPKLCSSQKTLCGYKTVY